MIVPEVFSQRRRYLPIGHADTEVICSNTVRFIPDISLCHLGVLILNVRMAWMRAAKKCPIPFVYNNFPWPSPTGPQRAAIKKAAQAVLGARTLCPDASLADLYDKPAMPPELRKAHQQNDRAVMAAYGFDVKTTTESRCVAELMKLYQALAQEK